MRPKQFNKYVELCSVNYIFSMPRIAKIEYVNDDRKQVYRYYKTIRERPKEVVERIQFTLASCDEVEAINYVEDDLDFCAHFYAYCMRFFDWKAWYDDAKAPKKFKMLGNVAQYICAQRERLAQVYIERNATERLIDWFGKDENAFFYIDLRYIPEKDADNIILAVDNFKAKVLLRHNKSKTLSFLPWQRQGEYMANYEG